MIRFGCVSIHPEDVSFFASDTIRHWLIRHPDWALEMLPEPFETSSADVLLLTTEMVNKHAPAFRLKDRTWVLLSAKKADAYRAWQLGAAGFLLRPLTLQDLERTFEQASQFFYGRRVGTPAAVPVLDLQMTKGRKFSVLPKDILFLEAQGEVTEVHLDLPGQEKVVATRNLGYWERQLGSDEFIRTHKKFLVNILHVSTLHPDEVLVREHRVPVAKRRRKTVEKRFQMQKNDQRRPS